MLKKINYIFETLKKSQHLRESKSFRKNQIQNYRFEEMEKEDDRAPDTIRELSSVPEIRAQQLEEQVKYFKAKIWRKDEELEMTKQRFASFVNDMENRNLFEAIFDFAEFLYKKYL